MLFYTYSPRRVLRGPFTEDELRDFLNDKEQGARVSCEGATSWVSAEEWLQGKSPLEPACQNTSLWQRVKQIFVKH